MSAKHIHLPDDEYFAALKEAAAKGDIDAAWVLADAYADGFVMRGKGAWFPVRRNRAQAERLYRLVAATGERDVILSLASVQKDLHEALRLERKAWRMGIVDAANNMAMTYSMMGRPKMCFRWLRRGYAIDPGGHAYHLALCHLVGYGTVRDTQKAFRLFGRIIRRKWGCPDNLECAAQFIKMIEEGKSPGLPRPGQSIGSIRPKLRSETRKG